ncbi:MAG: sulfatase-like hydrolase/transferase [Proteobacteria bacterium]|nr:sulfatase-like hydrolase/transferase [Pseudomonadota bacterium]MBU1686619.1 sulfatase-like hydrolase/transferase [Pseudomonadota bacterium]
MNRSEILPAHRIFSKILLLFLCLTLGFDGTQSASAETTPITVPPPPKPRHEDTNVILISLQCLRPDHLGLYGYQRKTSHNIDGLAPRSVVFDNAISQANLTPVAQMSVLTSQYPRINGMISFEIAKGQVSHRTLPETLKLYGYTTAATVSSPEFFLRYDADNGTMVNPGDIFSRSFDYFGRTRKGPGGKSVRRLPTEAFQWLNQNKDQKFFLWIASGLIHLPYAATVPRPYQTMYDPSGYIPFWKRLPLPNQPWPPDTPEDPSYDVLSRVFNNTFYWDFKPLYKLTEEDVSFINSRYDAGVYYTDLFIGNLLKLLDSLQLTEKTLIILQSIHGEDLGENGSYFHYDITDSIIKNALIMRFPGDEFGGRRIERQILGIDIMPTILNYLDIPVNHEAQGNSLLPLIRGEVPATAQTKPAFIDRLPWWEYTLDQWYLEFKSSQGAHFSPLELQKIPTYQALLRSRFGDLGYPPGDIGIRTNDWKLILRKNRNLLEQVSWENFITGKSHEFAEIELYDLKKDPAEQSNVVTQHPETSAELLKELQAWDATVIKHQANFQKTDERLIIPYP